MMVLVKMMMLIVMGAGHHDTSEDDAGGYDGGDDDATLSVRAPSEQMCVTYKFVFFVAQGYVFSLRVLLYWYTMKTAAPHSHRRDFGGCIRPSHVMRQRLTYA